MHKTDIIIGVVILLLFAYWMPKSIILSLGKFYPMILTHTQKSIIDSNKNNKVKQIALTFDDVPYSKDGSFREIIKLLDKHNMKGTFFVISNNVNETSRKLLVDIVKNGHQLGNHGKKDIMHFKLNKENLTKEIMDCDKLIKSIYSEANVDQPKTMLYRPGCGFFNNMMLNLCEELNYILTLGSVYPYDPAIQFPIINYLYLKYHISSSEIINDIVILHDRSWTPSMLDMFLDYMIQNNISSTTVQNLLNDCDFKKVGVQKSNL